MKKSELLKTHWQNMPEFVQEDLTSFRRIVVHFRNSEDVIKFAELINQRITEKQVSLWFPEEPRRKKKGLIYVDESEVSNLHSEQGQV